MSAYVDNFNAPYRGMIMCHLTADTREELDAMADTIGVQRKWIQHPGEWREHYDICQSKKALAIKAGAIEVTPRELVLRQIEKRKAVSA